jgi:uncharacterized protein (TIGR02145 family)
MNRTTNYILLFFLSIIISAPSCNEGEVQEPFCRISLGVKTESFYQDCIIPISVFAGNGNSSAEQVLLILDGQEIGNIKTAPYSYYWNTKGLGDGEHHIKAVYSTNGNVSISDELRIDLLIPDVICPDSIRDIDSNVYPVIQIGNQCWMQENLKTKRYANGVKLINGIDSLVGGLPNDLPGWFFAYERDSLNIDSLGCLYTWTSVMKGNQAYTESSGYIQGVCPDGWHVPSRKEWQNLIDHLGGSDIAAAQLKDTSMRFWKDDLVENSNYSKFTAFPGGCRVSSGVYIEKGIGAYFWSSTETIVNHAYHLHLNNVDSSSFLLGHQDSKRFGYSVRCIMD